MKYDWTNGMWLDGPGFVDWLIEQPNLLGDGSDFRVLYGKRDTKHDNRIRRCYRWKHERGWLDVWQADTILTELGGHIRDIPPRLWIDGPPPSQRGNPYDAKLRAKAIALYDGEKPVAIHAREHGVHPDTLRNWLKKEAA